MTRNERWGFESRVGSLVESDRLEVSTWLSTGTYFCEPLEYDCWIRSRSVMGFVFSMSNSILIKKLKPAMVIRDDPDFRFPPNYRMRFGKPIVSQNKVDQKPRAGYTTLDRHSTDLDPKFVFV